jgi:hypothetical protein
VWPHTKPWQNVGNKFPRAKTPVFRAVQSCETNFSSRYDPSITHPQANNTNQYGSQEEASARQAGGLHHGQSREHGQVRVRSYTPRHPTISLPQLHSLQLSGCFSCAFSPSSPPLPLCFSPSHLLIFSPSLLLTFSPSHLLTFSSSPSTPINTTKQKRTAKQHSITTKEMRRK